MSNLELIVKGYVESMLWSEPCNGTAPDGPADGHTHTTNDPQDCDASLEYIGYEIDDLAPSARKEIDKEVRDFVEANQADIDALLAKPGVDETDIGHNFLLTRNGHGAGFWDRGWGELGERLSAAARVYGTMGAYVGDDGMVYTHG